MKTIKETIDSLKEEDKRALRYAFENNVSHYVEYEKGKYVGVNTAHNKSLTVEQCAGSWYVGTVESKE